MSMSYKRKLPILVCILIALTILLLARDAYAQTVISIRPEETCNSSSSTLLGNCSSLDMALENIQSNTTLLLGPGNYTVRNTYIVMNKSDVSIRGNPEDPGSVIIECDESIGLVFVSIQRLNFTGLTVRDCGFKGKKVEELFTYIHSFIVLFFEPSSDFSTAIFVADCQDFVMENVVIRDNEGFGLVGINAVGNASFSRVNLTANHPTACVFRKDQLSQPGGSGGGMFLVYQDYFDNELNKRSNNSFLLFKHGHIEDNYNCRLDPFTLQYNKLSRSLDATYAGRNSLIGSGGVTLNVGQSSYHFNGTITKSHFIRNSGLYHGAGMEITQFKKTSDCHVIVKNCLFKHNGGGLTVLDEEAIDPFGAIVAAFFAPAPLEVVGTDIRSSLLLQTTSTVTVYGCDFIGNRAKSGAGITVFSFGPTSEFVEDRITISKSYFSSNNADYGSAIFITEISYSAFKSGLQVAIDSINVVNNSRLEDSLSSSFQSTTTGVVDVNYVNVSFVGRNNFFQNKATALSAYSSVVTMSGVSYFNQNVGTKGGGLSLDTESYLVLTGQSTKLYFVNNRALIYGGAIYVNLGALRTNSYDCFLFLDDVDVFCDVFERCSIPDNRFLITFKDNKAPFGSALYGSTIQDCPWNTQGALLVEQIDLDNGLSNLDPTRLPILFSPPLKVDNTTANTVATSIWSLNELGQYVSNVSKSVRPGEEFVILLGAFDRLNQSVPLTIFSQLLESEFQLDNSDDFPNFFPEIGKSNVTFVEENAYSTIGASNRFLLAGGDQKLLSEIPVRVFGYEGMNYTVTITSNEAAVQFYVFVTLTNCSEGFEFNDENLTCDCEISKFLDGVSCNDSGFLFYDENNWIGVDEEGNYIQAPCVFGYCEPGVSAIQLKNRDEQCSTNRSGILCGQCLEGHSRILGGNFCDICDDNNYLSLLVLFAAFGILLFLILALFNITITDGFINGFIFYANIVRVYTATFLPVTELRGAPPQVLISFLNLNFGIKSCFYDGATELQLVGLTLLFPVYMMFILFVVTLFGKYVTHKEVSNLFRKINITHIFATLFLYSYASLLKTCITILAFITVDGAYPSLRWNRDPNVVYSPGAHLFLVILCAAIVFVLIPLPIVLLIPSVASRVPFVKKLKPLIDAFIAPFSPGRSFWVSFRLLFRLLIFIIAAAGVSTGQLVLMSLLIASLTILQACLKPYTATSRNVVDILLMLNLTLFSILAVFFFEKSLSQEQVVMDYLFIFTYIFLIMLIALFCHYILKRFSCTRVPYEKIVMWLTEQINLVTEYLSNPTNYCSKGNKKKTKNDLSDDADVTNEVTHSSIALTNDDVEDTSFSNLREVLLEDEPRSSNNSRQSRNSTR